MSMIFNERVENGAFGAIERTLNGIPVVMAWTGEQYRFMPLTWTQEHVHTIALERNLLETSEVEETGEVANEFLIRYGRSGLRDDPIGAVVRAWENDYQCLNSKKWYGKRAAKELEIKDVSEGADQVADWMVETHSKLRVTAKCLCGLEVGLRLNPWDTVRLRDADEGIDAPFKLTRITYRTGKTIDAEFLSVDDCHLVYGSGS